MRIEKIESYFPYLITIIFRILFEKKKNFKLRYED